MLVGRGLTSWLTKGKWFSFGVLVGVITESKAFGNISFGAVPTVLITGHLLKIKVS